MGYCLGISEGEQHKDNILEQIRAEKASKARGEKSSTSSLGEKMASKDRPNGMFEEIIQVIVELIPGDKEFKEKLVGLIVKHLKPIFDEIENSRLPAIAVVGRRGSGKSSLINAIFGEYLAPTGSVNSETPTNKWLTFIDDKGNAIVDIMDTRGVQEGSRPKDAPLDIKSIQALTNAIREKTPDCFLFLEKSKEVSAAIEGDLKAFEKCIQLVHDKEKIFPIIIGIPTQCDELDPPGFWGKHDRDFYAQYWDSKDDEIPVGGNDDFENLLEKLKNIRAAIRTWSRQIESIPSVRRNNGYLKIIPTAAYLRFRKDKTIDSHPDADRRWNIDVLKLLILDELPTDAKLAFFRMARIKTAQKKQAQKIIAATSALCGAVGAIPTPPGFDMPFLFCIQITQIMLIGYFAGKKMNFETARDFLVATGLQAGASYLLREGFRSAAKFIPVAGWLISGGIAGAATVASGVMAEAYFIDGQKITFEDAKKIILKK